MTEPASPRLDEPRGTSVHDPSRPPFGRRLRSELLWALPSLIVSVATAMSFVQVFGRWDFLWPLVIAATLAHVLCAVVRLARPPAVVGLLTAPAIVLICIGWLRFESTLVFGLPWTETWTAVWADLRQAFGLIGEVVTPVAFDESFGTLAIVVIASVAVVTDAFAIRYGGRVEVFVPAAATLFIVAAVGTRQSAVALSAGWLMAALVSTAVIRRLGDYHSEITDGSPGTRRVGTPRGFDFVRAGAGTLAFAAVVALAASVVGPILPGAGQEAWLTQRAQSGDRILQPLVDIRRQLSDPSPAVLFTVRSEESAYWRMSSLRDFDGSTWTISQRLLDSAAGELAAPPGATDSGVDVTRNFQRFTVGNLAGNLVPVAATPTLLRSSTQSLFFEPESGSLLVGSAGLRPTDIYEVQSVMISPRPERLATAGVANPPSDSYLDLPDDTDDGRAVLARVRELAMSLSPPGASPYQMALAFQDFFRTQFTYSLDVPPLLGSDATLAFLDRRTGYCEHFASTFAVMARSVGLPARVAIGFTPGDRSSDDSGALVHTVRSTHAHAWPELWFDGIGWVLFEPTPGRGAPNATHTNVAEEQAPPTPTTTTLPPSTSTTVPDTSEPNSDVPDPATDPTGGDDLAPPDGAPMWPFALISMIAVAIGGWIVLVPRLVRSIISRRPESAVMNLWRRVVALYEYERGVFPRSLSPFEIATRATSRLYDDDPFIFEIAERATEELFASQVTLGDDRLLLERGSAYLQDRRRRLTPARRVRAVIDPIIIWRLAGGSRRSGEQQSVSKEDRSGPP